MQELLAANADPNQESNGGGTALSSACFGGQLESVQLLLAAGSRADYCKNGRSLLNATIRSFGSQREDGDAVGSSAPFAALLIGAAADVNVVDDQQQTALMTASRFGDVECVKLLLKNGADTRLGNDEGFTALGCACYWNEDHATMLALLEGGADPEGHVYAELARVAKDWNTAYTGSRYGAITAAMVKGRLEQAKLLIAYTPGWKRHERRKKLEASLTDTDRPTPMKEGFLAWLRDTRDWLTPLHYLDLLPRARVVQLLRDGADLHARARPGALSPLELAQASPHVHDDTSAAHAVALAATWCPASQVTFPQEARDRAIALARIGSRLIARGIMTLDVWQSIMANAVGRRQDSPFRLAPTCAAMFGPLDQPSLPLAALLARGDSDRPVQECEVALEHLDKARAMLMGISGFGALPGLGDGYPGDASNGHWEHMMRARMPMAERLTGRDLRLLPSLAAPRDPLPEGHVRAYCFSGEPCVATGGSRVMCEWEAPRLEGSKRVLCVLRLTKARHRRTLPHTLDDVAELTYSLEIASGQCFFIPVPEAAPSAHNAVSLTIFDTAGNPLLDIPDVIAGDGECYGYTEWYHCGDETHRTTDDLEKQRVEREWSLHIRGWPDHIGPECDHCPPDVECDERDAAPSEEGVIGFAIEFEH